MRGTIVIIITAIGVALGTTHARAEFVGLAVFREPVGGPGAPPLGPERWIYRLYAEFTQPTDSVDVWGAASATVGITNVTLDGLPGSGFTNIPNDASGNGAPYFPGSPRDYDTYMTIGVLYGMEGPSGVNETTVGTSSVFIPNGATSWAGGPSILAQSGAAQARADYRIAGNDTDSRVLIAQLVVNSGEHVSGNIFLSWKALDGPHIVPEFNVPFTSIPAPGTLAVLTCWGLCDRRRRRQ